MFGKIIFIGKVGDSAIYFNTKTAEIYKMRANKMLAMSETRNNSRNVFILMVIGIPSLGILTHFIGALVQGTVVYSPKIFLALCFLWIIECVGLTYIVEKAFYGPLKTNNILELATKSEFRQAVISNNLWNIYKNQKATLGKKYQAY